jgi:3-dehydroquinate dehydratase
MKIYSPEVYKIALMPKTEEDVQIIYDLIQYFKDNFS